MSYVLGVDGGNTKTIALVARSDGLIVGAGRAGCGDIYGASSEAAAVDAVSDAVEAAMLAASIGRDDLEIGTFSMAGAAWPEDFSYLHGALVARGFGREVLVVNDALGALRAGSPDGTGVVVAVGTGIAIGARAPSGCTWHSSFWPESLGAQALGERTLRFVKRVELGIEPPTSLTARINAYYGRATFEEVLHLLSTRERAAPLPDVAGLARVLLDEAERRDALARAIVAEQGALMGDYAAAAARRVGLAGTEFPLVLAGGVFRHPSGRLAEALVERVRDESPRLRLVRARFEPVVGALLLGLEAAGVEVGDTLLATVAGSLPGSGLFAT